MQIATSNPYHRFTSVPIILNISNAPASLSSSFVEPTSERYTYRDPYSKTKVDTNVTMMKGVGGTYPFSAPLIAIPVGTLIAHAGSMPERMADFALVAAPV